MKTFEAATRMHPQCFVSDKCRSEAISACVTPPMKKTNTGGFGQSSSSPSSSGFVASLFEFAIGRLGVDGSFVIVEELRVLERVAG